MGTDVLPAKVQPFFTAVATIFPKERTPAKKAEYNTDPPRPLPLRGGERLRTKNRQARHLKALLTANTETLIDKNAYTLAISTQLNEKHLISVNRCVFCQKLRNFVNLK